MTGEGEITVSATHRPHLVALDSLRGIAALIVAIYHLRWIQPSVLAIFHRGFLMVDLFFVLSGFAISYAYLARLRTVAQLGHFIWLRFWRLYPLHLFFLLFFFAVELLKLVLQSHVAIRNPAFSDSSLLAMLSNLFLLQGLHTTGTVTFNAPSWSISAEFYVYILFGLIALYARRRAVLWLSALVCLAACAALLLVWPGQMDLTYDFGWVRCLAGFFLGGLVHAAYAALARTQFVQARQREIGILALAALVLFALFLVVGPGSDFAVIPLSALLILAIALSSQSGPMKILRARPAAWLGAVSYSVYMAHYAVIFVLSTALRFGLRAPTMAQDLLTGRPAWTVVFDGAYLVILLAVAHLTFRGIETPFRNWSRAARLF